MSSLIRTPHDKLFRASLKDIHVAREYFEKYLPEKIRKVINLDVLEICPEIHISKHLRRSESDVVYRTEILNKTGYIYIANEHETNGELFMPLRVLSYNIDIWNFYRKQYPDAKKLPLIVNIVFYTGSEPYIYPTDFKDLIDAPQDLIDEFWAKPFKLIQLKDISDEELLEQKWAGLFQYFMKNIKSPDLLDVMKKVLPLLKFLDLKGAVNHLETVINYALFAGEISNIRSFFDTLSHELSPETSEKIMTGAQKLIEMGKEQGMQQGMQQGIQQGMEQGAIKGEQTLLKRLLSRRFRQVPSLYLEKIEQADSEQLLTWSDKVFEARSIEDIFENYH